jgi:two-component system chemotaxis response regulator CheY
MSKRILIVDDSSMMRKMISKILQPGGHTIVGEAKTGAEAVDLYKTLDPDLVTMDITMRGMDGFTAAKEILRYDDKAQIIFLSNLDEDKYGPDAQNLGAVGYVSKHKSRELLDIIENP